jgi:hypothetical protein
MIRRVISGGQTGADMAGLRAARVCGLESGGTAPCGWRTERGNDLRLRDFGLVESGSPDYPPRTEANVRDADMTLVLSPPSRLSGGSLLTFRLCEKHKKPVLHINALLMIDAPVDWVVRWIKHARHETVNVAGSRESKYPGLEDRATDYLQRLFTAVNAEAE